jgi:DNA adenine methylase
MQTLKRKLKTPITYYGGKQRLLSHILPLFPPHVQYVEPFIGGGAVYFAKEPSRAEVINDKKNEVTNFYRVLKNDFAKLNKMIQGTLHSECDFLKSREILKAPLKNKIEYAWAFWCQTRLTFSSNPLGGFSFVNNGKSAYTTYNKKREFTDAFEKRLMRTEVFCRDAVKLIKLKDTPDTFFYCDPPYVTADQGFYSGYTMENFDELLNALSKIQGKFLLSSYPEKILLDFRKACKWNSKDISQSISAGKCSTRTKSTKLECLTWNY